MTDIEIQVAKGFRHVAFGFQKGQRNFAYNMLALAEKNPSAKLSKRQQKYLFAVARRFVDQMPEELRFRIRAIHASYRGESDGVEPNPEALDTAREICEHLGKVRFQLTREKELQRSMYGYMLADFPTIEREFHLGDGDIIDFMVHNVGIEVKLKGSKRAIYRQLERYAEHEQVHALVFATNVAMGMPDEIGGKPIFVVNLGKAWL